MEPTDTRLPGAEPGATAPLDPAISRARDLAQSGAVREGMTALEAIRPRARALPDLDRAVLLAALVDCRLARGDLAEAMGLGDAVAPLLDAGGLAAAVAHHAKGELAGALGDPELALAHFLTVGRLAAALPGLDIELVPWRAGAALASMRTGDPRGAAVLAHRFVDDARADGRAPVLALALRTLAAVDAAGAASDRLSHLRAARALLDDGSAERLAAQIDTDLAGLSMMSPPGTQPDDVLALLRSAELLATRQELWPLQSRIRRHLERLGEVPRRVDREAAALLTASEHKVCRLALDGLGNRAIADQLGVGVKAVEWHLGHVYRKLGISSRAQLSQALGTAL